MGRSQCLRDFSRYIVLDEFTASGAQSAMFATGQPLYTYGWKWPFYFKLKMVHGLCDSRDQIGPAKCWSLPVSSAQLYTDQPDKRCVYRALSSELTLGDWQGEKCFHFRNVRWSNLCLIPLPNEFHAVRARPADNRGRTLVDTDNFTTRLLRHGVAGQITRGLLNIYAISPTLGFSDPGFALQEANIL